MLNDQNENEKCLDLKTLSARLRAWSEDFRKQMPRLGSCPIMLYQRLYAKTHELRGSFPIAATADTLTLEPALAAADDTLRDLAYGVTTLGAAESQALFELAQCLEDLRPLSDALAKMTLLPCGPSFATFVENFIKGHAATGWDSFSKARLGHAGMHGYGFWNTAVRCQLSELPQTEMALELPLLQISALIIRRSLTPCPEGVAIEYLAAAPGDAALDTGPIWKPFTT